MGETSQGLTPGKCLNPGFRHVLQGSGPIGAALRGGNLDTNGPNDHSPPGFPQPCSPTNLQEDAEAGAGRVELPTSLRSIPTGGTTLDTNLHLETTANNRAIPRNKTHPQPL